MHKLSLLFLALALVGCANSSPKPTASLRKPGAPIWSNAQLDLARLPGRWRQVAGFGAGEPGCAPGGVEISGPPGALWLAARLCLAGQEQRLSGPMERAGPGRFRVADQDWWVIWVDTDYRTLAIGTPSGAFGFLLNRDGNLPPDRLRAAREIFDFNGYDLERMQVF